MLKAIKNIFKPEKIVLSDGQEIQPPKSIVPYVIIGLVISVLLASNVTGFSLSTIMKRGSEFFIILKGMIPPDFSYAKSVLSPFIRHNKNVGTWIYDRMFYSYTICYNIIS